MKIEALLTKLDKVKKHGKGYMACCPAHEDRTPSLSIAQAPDGRVLLKCFAGCDVHSIVQAVGMSISDIMPERIADYLPGAFAKREHTMSKEEEHDELFVWQCNQFLRRGQKLEPGTLKDLRAAAERIKRRKAAHASS